MEGDREFSSADHDEDAPDGRLRDAQGHGSPPAPGAVGADLTTVAASVALTTAVIPFVQGLVTRAGEETYDLVRRKLRALVRKHADVERHPQAGDLLVVDDPSLPLRLHLRTDVTDEALRALAELDFPALADGRPEHPATVSWDPEIRSWRVTRHRAGDGEPKRRRRRVWRKRR